MEEPNGDWVTMTEAARQLGMPISLLSRRIKRLADAGHPVETRQDVFNRKVILVSVSEIREALKRHHIE